MIDRFASGDPGSSLCRDEQEMGIGMIWKGDPYETDGSPFASVDLSYFLIRVSRTSEQARATP